MSCFPCFSSEKPNPIKINDLPVIQAVAKPALPSSLPAGIYINMFGTCPLTKAKLYFLALYNIQYFGGKKTWVIIYELLVVHM